MAASPYGRPGCARSSAVPASRSAGAARRRADRPRSRADARPAPAPTTSPVGVLSVAPGRTPRSSSHARDGVVPGRNLPALDLVPAGGRVCLFRALPGLGDLLCAVPAMRALRLARPDASITLVTHPATVEIARRFRGYLDEIIPFPGFPGLPDQRPDVRALPGFLASMQSRGFDLAVQLHGAGDRTNDVVCLFGARRTAGFTPRGTPPPEPARYLPWHEAEHDAVRWLRLLTHLGLPASDPDLEFPAAPDADAQLDAALAAAGLSGFEGPAPVVVHPGASTAARRWPARGFAAVIDRLVLDGRPVMLTGSAADRDATALVMRLVEHPDAVIDLTGRTSLDALAGLLRRAKVLVANDTGVSHLAAALRTPSVIVFSATEPGRWAPLDTSRHRVVVGGSPRRVAAEALRLLHGSAARS
jgi:ADP-heptose:LPS heptosyltransferase